MRVVVIGAGVLGSAVAASLARRGCAVTVVEQAPRVAAETSATTFSWINANRKRPAAYHELNAAGLAAHYDLARGGGNWFHPSGHLEWADEQEHRDELAERVARLRAAGYPVEELDPAAAGRLEPDLRVPPGADVVFYPEEGYCHPLALVARLLGEARDLGAHVVTGERVDGVEQRRGRAEVRLRSGRRLWADRVTSCAGRETSALLAPLKVTVPMVVPTKGNAAVGFLAETAPAPLRMSRVVTTDTLSLRPAGGGRLTVQAVDLDDAAEPGTVPRPDSAVGREMSRRLSALLPPGAVPELESLVVGERVLPGDGLTVAGRLRDHPWLSVVVTHSGVTLAPLLGELIAAEIVDDARCPLLDDFRPERFEAAVPAGQPPLPRRPGEQ